MPQLGLVFKQCFYLLICLVAPLVFVQLFNEHVHFPISPGAFKFLRVFPLDLTTALVKVDQVVFKVDESVIRFFLPFTCAIEVEPHV